MCFFAIFLKNFNFEKACETKTFLIVHDVPRIFCDIRKKKEKKTVRLVCLQKKKKILISFGDAKSGDFFWISSYTIQIYHVNVFRQSNYWKRGFNLRIIISIRDKHYLIL